MFNSRPVADTWQPWFGLGINLRFADRINLDEFLGMFKPFIPKTPLSTKSVSKIKPSPNRFILSRLFVASFKIHVVLKFFLKLWTCAEPQVFAIHEFGYRPLSYWRLIPDLWLADSLGVDIGLIWGLLIWYILKPFKECLTFQPQETCFHKNLSQN